ncbi:hypothetical protein GCM10010193_62340 [Kitasatospora atroaurantiaca]
MAAATGRPDASDLDTPGAAECRQAPASAVYGGSGGGRTGPGNPVEQSEGTRSATPRPDTGALLPPRPAD